MFISNIQRRVTYGETDQMGYLYYGNYPSYFESGRTESLRNIGIVYKELEQQGIMMPVTKMEIKYLRPAHYDDLLTITTEVRELPQARIGFHYLIENQDKILLTLGFTELIFLDATTKKPSRCPDYVLEKLLPYFKQK
jgi:acyl-CoA thioester hydrolase